MCALPIQKLPAFVAECTLGKLAKWLRLAGLDTQYDSMPPDVRRLAGYVHDQNRYVLSRTQRVIGSLKDKQGVLIQSDAPIDQVRQVFRVFNVQQSDLKPLSRCSICNFALQQASREYLQSAVPEYIRQGCGRFRMCPKCLRVYWPGTHGERILALIDRWFEK